MECPQCQAAVTELLEVDLRRVWRETYARPRGRQTWRLFPCGHQLMSEDSTL